MRPVQPLNPLIKYGIPAAAGLAVGGMLAQDQQPGVAALGGLGAALGAYGGLRTARLAGKYMAPEVLNLANQGKTQIAEGLTQASQSIGKAPISDAAYKEYLDQAARTGAKTVTLESLNKARLKANSESKRAALLGGLAGAVQGIKIPQTPEAKEITERILENSVASLAIPASAGLAALGGQAAGMIPGALNVPGFAPQQQSLDPESYGSSNSPGARYKQTTGSAGITGYYQ